MPFRPAGGLEPASDGRALFFEFKFRGRLFVSDLATLLSDKNKDEAAATGADVLHLCSCMGRESLKLGGKVSDAPIVPGMLPVNKTK